MAIKHLSLTLLVAWLSTGCLAYHNPTFPDPPAFDDATPTHLTLSVPGNGVVVAYVQNGKGAPLANLPVTFFSDTGSVAPSMMPTDGSGHASSLVSAAQDAHVTASTGPLSAHAVVAVVTAPAVQPPVTPQPPGPTPPPPPPPSVFLNVSGNATTGLPLAFGVSSNALGVTWTWMFGDGASVQTTAFSTSHIYGLAGTYTASVSGTGTAAASATILVTDPIKK
jgi:hypothetical protein